MYSMKEVLLIDLNDNFRDFMVNQLSQQLINVTTAYGDRDSFSKILTVTPDLIIVEAQTGLDDLMDFLRQKLKDPNARSIPMILCGPPVEMRMKASLAAFGVIKYFTKPIKYDVFLEEIGKALKQKLSVDDTKCSIEVHISGDIIFIEIANGLNLEKLEILKYKVTDIINENSIRLPKVILLISNIKFTFMDAPNIELLLNNILAEPRILNKNLKVLCYDNFVKSIITGNKKYSGVQITGNITKILQRFREDLDTSNLPEAVHSTLLTHKGNSRVGNFSMHFKSEEKSENIESSPSTKIAIIDNDISSCKNLYRSLNSINAETSVFISGKKFLSTIKEGMYDVIILELAINDVNGFELLKYLKDNRITTPVIIYSIITRKEYIANCLSLGAKAYILKNQKIDVITTKVIDILNGE